MEDVEDPVYQGICEATLEQSVPTAADHVDCRKLLVLGRLLKTVGLERLEPTTAGLLLWLRRRQKEFPSCDTELRLEKVGTC